jgi:hypothetical protein
MQLKVRRQTRTELATHCYVSSLKSALNIGGAMMIALNICVLLNWP